MPAVTSIITVAEAKTHMNIAASDTTHETEIQGFVDAATPVIEDIAGAVIGTTWTGETHLDACGRVIYLSHVPVYSVTSVTEYRLGTAYTLTPVSAGALRTTANSYNLDSATGRLIRNDGWGDVVVVDYVAGRGAVPANIRLAALELVRHLYQLSQQGGRPAFGGAADDGPWLPSGFAVPTRVVELLVATPNMARPSVA